MVNDCEIESFDHSNDIQVVYDKTGEAYIVEDDERLYLLEQGCVLSCFDFKERQQQAQPVKREIMDTLH